MALTTSGARRAWGRWKCNRADWKEITLFGRKPVRIISFCYDAWKALETAMVAEGYPAHVSNVGSYNCRSVRDSAHASLHAYRIAVDVDPANNRRKRYGTTRKKWWQWSKITRAQVAAVLAIRTNNGKRVFTHGGSFRSQDPMHFQIACTPADMRKGIDFSTVRGHSAHTTTTRTGPRPSVGDHPVLRKTSRSVSEAKLRATKELQAALNVKGAKPELKVDGKFGSGTASAVKKFQKSHKLSADGVVGKRTWAALDEV